MTAATHDSGEGQRRELADFLRTRRDQVDRSALGLPPRSRRGAGGTSGLRREEVAALSGVSVTWYTWLEQARKVNPSRQVLGAVARALQLTPVEQTYLLTLVGFTAAAVVDDGGAAAPEHVQHLLDALDGSPAFAITSDWSISAWNDSYRALYPGVATADVADRNLLRVVFTDPFVRGLLPDWDVTSRRFLAEFRAEAGPRLGQPECVRLVDRLLADSPEFRDGWSRHDIEGFASRRRSFQTAAGLLEFEHHRLAVADRPDLYLVVYTPTGPATTRALRRLRKG